MRLYIFVIFSFLSITELYSQSSDSTIHSTTEPVVIKASRLSLPISSSIFSVDVVESKKLGRINNALTIKEALSLLPSVLTNNRFNMAQGDRITIRGIGARAQFGVRGIKILLDGIPLTFVDGQSQLNNLNINLLERIEIIRGASSSLYGNSSGGVINIKSSFNKTNPLTIQPSVSFGSFGLSKYGLGISGQVIGGGISLNGYVGSSNGFREHSEAKFGGFNFLTGHKISSNISLNTVINYYNAPYLLNPSSLNKEDAQNNPTKARSYILNQGSGKMISQIQLGVSIGCLLSSNSEIKTTFYGINRNLLNSIPSNIIDLKRLAGGVRFEFITQQKLADIDIRLLVGTDYEVQNDQRKEYVNLGLGENVDINPDEIFDNLLYGDIVLDQNEKVNGLGIFSQLGINPSEKIIFIFGLRYDNYKFNVNDNLVSDEVNSSDNLKMDNISPTIGMSYTYLEDQWIYGNYSTAFQTPTTNELSNNPNDTGGFNNNLNPELQRGYEIGLRGWLLFHKLYYNFTFFNNKISNILIPYQNSEEVTYYRNGGEAKNKGGEIFIRWNTSSVIELSASYSLMNFKYTDFMIQGENEMTQLSGNFVPGIPKNNLNFLIAFSFPLSISMFINLNWTDKYFTNDYNGPQPNTIDNIVNYTNDAYFVTNLGFQYKLNTEWLKLSVNLGIENIFDMRYNDSIIPNAFGNNFFEPASGRAWYFSTTLEL